MSEQQHHHHHHHHHQLDDATIFKHKQLNSIKRRKIIKKWAFRALVVVAIIMAIATIVVYRMR